MSKFFPAALAGLFLGFASSAMAAPACTLVVEADSGKVVVQEGDQCGVRTSPASTFKVALAVIGYDAGILVDAHNPAWPYKPEYEAFLDAWKQTIDPTSWEAYSVVWYSQELTRKLGLKRFQAAVDKLGYGNRDLSGDPGKRNGLTHAWLSSSLAISPLEQADFLRKLLAGSLALSKPAQVQTVAILPQFPLAEGWVAHGKTGSGYQKGRDGKIDRNRQFGWFVGWAEKDGKRLVFVRLLKDDAKMETYASIRARDTLLADLPKVLAGL